MTLGAAVAATFLVSTGLASAHGFDRNCGSQHQLGAGWYHVKSFNTKCGEARDTARHYWRTGDHHFNGWKCTHHRTGYETSRANCTRNRSRHQHIKFSFGA
jgi:hypothetical protein